MNETNSITELEEKIHRMADEKRWEDAIRLLESQFSAVENNWRLSWNLGWFCFKLERLAEAQKHLTRATKLAPQDAICKWALGVVYLERGNFKKAAESLRAALRIKSSQLARQHLALTYLKQGRLAEAENLHLEGIRRAPKRAERYETYACFLEDVGREEEAEKMYQKAKELQEIQ